MVAATGLVLAAGTSSARAETCKFSEGTPGYGASGNSAAMIANGSVSVTTPSTFKTPYYIDVGVWVDDALLAFGADAPQKALNYFEHTNCIYGAGVNGSDGSGTHNVSLRIAGNRLRRFVRTAGPPPGGPPGWNGYWTQQTHREFAAAIAALGPSAPKVNLLVSGARYVEIKIESDGTYSWDASGGASNGTGQGQALIGVNPGFWRNTTAQPNNEDWQGVLAAHEIGHSTGGKHLSQYFATMCCNEPLAYTAAQKTMSPSRMFSVPPVTWNQISALDAATGDAESDPFQSTPDPYTNQTWSYPQVHDFLTPYTFPDATLRRYTGLPCVGSSCVGWEPIDDDQSVAQTVAADGRLYKLRTNGAIYQYTWLPCFGITCQGWIPLDVGTQTKAIAATGTTLYKMHANGSIWRFTSGTWQMLDNNGATTAIVAGLAGFFQLHADGTVWRSTGAACTATACPGWQLIASGAVSLVAASDLYMQRADGSIYRNTSGSLWVKLDNNPASVSIVAAGSSLFQLHDTGAIWRYTGVPCTGNSCPGWQKLDNNPATVALAVGGLGFDLYQLHASGAVWRWTFTPCSGNSCPGWQKLDATGATEIITGPGLYQVR